MMINVAKQMGSRVVITLLHRFYLYPTESNQLPSANAGGRKVLVLPNSTVVLDGSRSTDDQGIVSYLWSRDSSSPAAGVRIDAFCLE